MGTTEHHHEIGRSLGHSCPQRQLLFRLFLTCAFALAAILIGRPAQAQDQTFTLDRAQISGAPDDGFMVHRAYVGEETRVYTNAALGFSLNPLRDSHLQPGRQVEGAAPIVGQFPVYLTGGLQLMGIFGVNVHIPFTPLQLTGQEPEDANTAGLTDYHAAMNDIRIDARLAAWDSNDKRTRLGVFGAFTLPTGSRHGFGGDRQATALLAAAGEHTFGKLLVAGHLGPHFRPSRSIGSPDGLFVSSELRYAFGAYYPLRDNQVRLGLEVWGSTGIVKQNDESTFFNGRHTTFEWLAQGRFVVSKDKQTYLNAGLGTRLSNGYGSADVRALISIGRYFLFKDRKPEAPPLSVIVDSEDMHDVDTDGDGYPDDVDACPTVKEDGLPPNPTDGCPAPKDRDNDGIIDDKDKCPDDPEDKDGIQDEDGCPEDDADRDKVLDVVDKCPEEPGPPNKDPEKNGCPTLTKVTADGMVSLLKPIEFDYGKSTIKPVSFPILQEVATLMEARSEIKIQIQGHTDNMGTHEYNVKLSKDRAASVMRYLTGEGIAKSRLTSEGYGPDRPVASNDTDEGRARNRRVDFVIEDGAPKEDAWQ